MHCVMQNNWGSRRLRPGYWDPTFTSPLLTFSKSGDMIGAATAKVAGVEAFGSGEFTVFFPRTPEIVTSLDITKTRVSYESTDH